MEEAQDIRPSLRVVGGRESVPAIIPDTRALSEAAVAWMLDRGISEETCLKAGVYSQRTERGAESIRFAYDQDQPAIKIRRIPEKGFFQEGAASTLWLSEYVQPGQDLIILEGEMDVLACMEAGLSSCVSCPNGAPQAVSDRKVDPKDDRKYGFIWQAKTLLKDASRVVLATDNDPPGEALAEELARRIGKARCWQVIWPAGIKDANECLLKLGAAELKRLVENPTPWPIAGVFSPSHYRASVQDYYHSGLGLGALTGWANVDELFTVKTGHLIVVTGTPASGKSAWTSALMVNLSLTEGWRWAVQSTEIDPAQHLAMLASLKVGKPFYQGPTPRMSEAELDDAMIWAEDHFTFLASESGMDLPGTLDRLETACLRYGIRGFIIDPASYMRLDGDNVEAVGVMLEAFKAFAVSHECVAILVAHPHKMRVSEDGSSPVPTGYQISGSSHWNNRPDIGITIHRTPENRSVTQFHLWKSRFSWIAREGMTELYFDPPTGRYSDAPFAWSGMHLSEPGGVDVPF